MPIFEFECNDCGEFFEELCGADLDGIKCPKCNSTNFVQRMTAPSPLKKGAFPFKPGPVHPIARSPNRPRQCGACQPQGCGMKN